MKSYLTLMFLLYSATLFAQGKFSASVSVGTGYSVAHENIVYINYKAINYNNVGNYYFNGSIGYQLHRWRLNAGLAFFRTGFHKGFAYANDPFVFYENIQAHSEHIAIPLLLSYRLPLSKVIGITPVAGGTMVFTTGSHYYTNDMTLNIDPWDGLAINPKTAPAAMVKIFADVRIAKKTALFAGPSLTFFKPGSQLQQYLFIFEAGISRTF